MSVKIQSYNANIIYKNKCTICKILLKFEQNISYLKFGLSDIVEFSTKYKYLRNFDSIQIYFHSPVDFVEIETKFKCNNNSAILFKEIKLLPCFSENYYIKELNIISEDYLLGGNYKKGILENIILGYSRNKGYICIKENMVKSLDLPNIIYKFDVSKFYEKEIKQFFQFFEYLFDMKISCKIIFNDIEFSKGISSKGLIIINEKIFIEKYKATLFLYIFHELIHQVIGNVIFFTGEYAMIICEGITEYLTLYYLKCRFGEKFYDSQILKHKKKCEDLEKNKNIDLIHTLNKESYMFSKEILILDRYFSSKIDEKKEMKILISKIMKCKICSDTFVNQLIEKNLINDNGSEYIDERKYKFKSSNNGIL